MAPSRAARGSPAFSSFSIPAALTACLLFLSSGATAASSATVAPAAEPPEGGDQALLDLDIHNPGSDQFGLQMVLAPLTPALGLGQPQVSRQIVSVEGRIVATNESNFNTVDNNTIAYLCCDPVANGTAPANILNALVDSKTQPRAVILYSRVSHFCALGGNFAYGSLVTTTDHDDAGDLLAWLSGQGESRGPYYANFESSTDDFPNPGGDDDDNSILGNPGSSQSAVAMSILYSITGLVTLLFIIIIGTGAIRAHRHPERYGPRRAAAGRPRQSRARGLALAVLETIPVVKFRGSDPARDVEMKLDNLNRDDAAAVAAAAAANRGHDTADGAVLYDGSGGRPGSDDVNTIRITAVPASTPAVMSGAEPAAVAATDGPGRKEKAAASAPVASAAASPGPQTTAESDGNPRTPASPATPSTSTAPAAAAIAGPRSPVPDEEHLGCSICTEDFVIGDDIRVLPCSHKFHCSCVDPWLLNVSGTCPLCRLDLRSKGAHAPKPPISSPRLEDGLPPPLDPDESAGHGPQASSRPTLAHFLSVPFRYITHEERLTALRHMASQQRATRTAGQQQSQEDVGRRARLANRLRESFRIRTHSVPFAPASGQQPSRSLSQS